MRRVLAPGGALDPARTHRVHTIDYLAAGGDGQTALTHGADRVFGPPVVDVVDEHVQRHSPVAPTVEGRVKLVGSRP